MFGGILFVALNLADSWLTKQALALGMIEFNPIVRHFGYGDSLALGLLLPLAIIPILLYFKNPICSGT